MKSKFDEEVKIESRYNLLPKNMRRSQRDVCIGCEYRISRLQYDLAEDEAQKRGGSPRIYLGGFYMRSIPACDRKKCLVSGFVLIRGAKAPSSFKKIIKPRKLNKLNEIKNDQQ